jgi:hypothetical protein
MEETSNDIVSENFTSNPIALDGKKLVIKLDSLNSELDKYNLRVNSLSDIFIDRELSNINAGDVLRIYATKISGADEWDEAAEKWFFEDTKELEDRFEASFDIISSVELDRGDLVFTIYLNTKGIELEKIFAAGGALEEDNSVIEARVEEQLKNVPSEVFKMVGMDFSSEEDRLAKNPEAKLKLIEHYKKQIPKPVFVHIHGRKINLGHGATMDSIYLQTQLLNRCLEYAAQNLNGNDNKQFASEYANNKSVLGVDMIRGMAIEASNSSANPFLVTDEILRDVVGKVCG